MGHSTTIKKSKLKYIQDDVFKKMAVSGVLLEQKISIIQLIFKRSA